MYGSEANAPTSGARTQSVTLACAVVVAPRAATLLPAAIAWVVNRAAATSAADKNVTLVMWFSMVKEAKEVRLLRFKCGEPCVVKSKISSRTFKHARSADLITQYDARSSNVRIVARSSKR